MALWSSVFLVFFLLLLCYQNWLLLLSLPTPLYTYIGNFLLPDGWFMGCLPCLFCVNFLHVRAPVFAFFRSFHYDFGYTGLAFSLLQAFSRLGW